MIAGIAEPDAEPAPACQRAYAAYLSGNDDQLRKLLVESIKEYADLITDRARLERRSGERGAKIKAAQTALAALES